MGFLRRAPLVAAAVVVGALALAGCGDGSAQTFSGDGNEAEPGGGGELVYVVPAEPATLDPLRASDPWSQTAPRQIFEPLVARVPAPYDRRGLDHGLALGWRHSADFRVWTFVLRDGVRFQDGSAFDGQAVVANANRWRSDPVGREALPGLIAADTPRPDTVRLILSRAALDLPSELGDPRLGIVSPLVLRAAAGGPLTRFDRAGTGPFELRGAAPDTTLVRSATWWATPLGLGPALDSIEFRAARSPLERVRQLHEGEAEVAPDLPETLAEGLRTDPLLAVIGTGEDTIAIQRSVRGIHTWRPQPLSGAWLAVLGGG